MNNDYKDRMDRVIKYIEENSNQKLSLDILADVSNFSKYHFARIFTSIVGVTPVAFVNQVRVQKAVYLLVETAMPILQISNECGFESVSTFNALLRSTMAKHQVTLEIAAERIAISHHTSAISKERYLLLMITIETERINF